MWRALAVLLALLSAPAIAAETLPGPIPARLVRIIDGDTLLVRAHIWLGHEVTTLVRLLGIDAPELRGRCAEESAAAERARAFVARVVGRSDVTLTDLRFDKYGGRVLARVEVRGQDLARALLAEGLARPYRGKMRAGWCQT
ncbi:MAG: nuclease [Alphaproteobacteria bacterium]|nr:nuclease [Alphaproteobacteria bacterium]